MSKVRIYDLAKELKLESKKILEDARRMGVDVSVPSNTLPDNIAAKIREMYYPKKEQAPAIHKARLIKHPVPPATPGVTAGSNAEQSAAAPAIVERAQQLHPPTETTAHAQKATPPVSQTTIKTITPPKPAAPATPPTAPPPASQAAPQLASQTSPTAAPGAEQKARVVK